MARRRDERQDDVAGGRVSILGAFEWRSARGAVRLTASAQRLIAVLALRHHPLSRSSVAGILWPDSTEVRAMASLRTELWKLGKGDSPVAVTGDGRLVLDPAVTVDLHEAIDLARRVIDGGIAPSTADVGRLLVDDVLPDWAEDWAAIERERFRQLRLHALDALCARQADERHYAAAVETALAAVDADPYRESSRRCLIAAYIGEGNVHDAVDQFDAFRRLLADDLEAEPTHALRSMIHGAISPAGPLTRR